MVEAGAVILIVLTIAWAFVRSKGDLARLQLLKSRKRFGGKRLPPSEQAELERLSRKYWWH
jgi:hypothetical protein